MIGRTGRQGDTTLPLIAIHKHGSLDFPGSLDTDDLRFLSSPRTDDRLTAAFRHCPYPLVLHFVNVSQTCEELYGSRLKRDHLGHSGKHHFYSCHVGILSPHDVRNLYGVHIDPVPGAVSVVLVENHGRNRLGFTPWMVSHRVSHAFIQKEGRVRESTGQSVFRRFQKIESLMTNSYETTELVAVRDHVPYIFGTMSSCRRQTLFSYGEWPHECFAQLCLTGRIKLNPAQQVHTIIWKGREIIFRLKECTRIEDVQEAVGRLPGALAADFREWHEPAIGKIVVL